MAETYSIEAQVRTVFGKKCGALRRQGLVPGVVYGPKITPIHIQIPERPLQVTLLKAGGTNLINLSVDGKTHSVLAREVQRHVIRGNVLHIDFLAVDMAAKIRTTVPLRFVNESPAVIARLGTQVTGASNVEIESLPGDLPDHIAIDMSALLNVNDSIHVRDLALGNRIEIVSEPDEMIVRIAALTTQEEVDEATEEEEVSTEPEVITRGKKEEEEDEV